MGMVWLTASILSVSYLPWATHASATWTTHSPAAGRRLEGLVVLPPTPSPPNLPAAGEMDTLGRNSHLVLLRSFEILNAVDIIVANP